MTHLAVRSCAVVLALVVAVSPLTAQTLPKAASPEAVGLSSERLARLTRVMKEAVEARQVAGTVTLVMRDGSTSGGGSTPRRYTAELAFRTRAKNVSGWPMIR